MSGAPDDDPDPPHRPLRLGWGFWLALGLGLACVLAGLALARLGPTLLPAPHQGPGGRLTR